MSNTTATASRGVPTMGLLGIVLVILKATGHLNWPWIWVLAPFWGPWALLILALAGVGLVCLVLALLDRRARRRRLARRRPR